MKQTVNFNTFYDAFQQVRPNNFSYEGLQVLYDFLEEVDPDMELDVIALCCDFSESTYGEIARDYDIDLSEAEQDGAFDDEEASRLVLDHLHENTVVVGVTDEGTVVYQQF